MALGARYICCNCGISYISCFFFTPKTLLVNLQRAELKSSLQVSRCSITAFRKAPLPPPPGARPPPGRRPASPPARQHLRSAGSRGRPGRWQLTEGPAAEPAGTPASQPAAGRGSLPPAAPRNHRRRTVTGPRAHRR